MAKRAPDLRAGPLPAASIRESTSSSTETNATSSTTSASLPGADPSQIAISHRGADSVRLTRGGDLAIAVGDTTVRQRAPVAYQRIDGERRIVDSAYELTGRTVGFRLGAYDSSRPLVIDPVVLAYSTFVGGSGTERGLRHRRRFRWSRLRDR